MLTVLFSLTASSFISDASRYFIFTHDSTLQKVCQLLFSIFPDLPSTEKYPLGKFVNLDEKRQAYQDASMALILSYSIWFTGTVIP